MKLIRLHIENFGRLSNVDMDFTSGVNQVLRENGWGKSTLAAFLRVMFYGLEGARKKELDENDRAKYKPWNGGHFGGSIEFEAGGKHYIATRNFGEKEKDATFRLQDAVTLLDSQDFSERLGEELFEIDRESYERTSFIDRAALKYRGINSTIGSKVGSTTQKDDLSNYDAAQAQMKDYLNANSAKKKLGSLFQLGDEIAGLEREIKKEDIVNEKIGGLREALEKEREELASNEDAKRSIQKEQGNLAENKAMAINAKHLSDLQEAYHGRHEKLAQRLETFGGKVPKREDLHRLECKVDETEKCLAQLSGFEKVTESERYERLKRYFQNGVPSHEEIQSQIDQCNEVQNCMRSMSDLEDAEARSRNQLEEMELEGQRLEMEAKVAAQQAAKERSKKNVLSVSFIALSVLVGSLTLVLHLNALLWILVAVLLLIGLFPMVISLAGRSKKEDRPISEAALLERRKKDLRESLATMKKERQGLESDIREKEEQIRGFLSGFEISYSRSDAERILYEMQNRASEYLDLKAEKEEKDARRKAFSERAQGLQTELSALLSEQGLTVNAGAFSEIKAWIRDTLQSLAAYESEQSEEERARKALEAFKEEHQELMQEGLKILSEEEIAQAEQALRQRLEELGSADARLHDTIAAYRQNLNDAYAEAEELQAKKDLLEQKKEERAQKAVKYELVLKTQEYLQSAKEQFTARFMQPIKTAFDKYYELMSGADGSKDFQIDANMNVFRKEEGKMRDIEAQSEGLSDMIGLCIRLALLDVMYEKEKPLVIMDDPFTCLDPDHLAGARQFMQEVSKEYQILYLTCHDSRQIKA